MSLPNRTMSLPESLMRDAMPATRTDAVAPVAPGTPVVRPEPDRVVHAVDAVVLCMLDGCVGG